MAEEWFSEELPGRWRQGVPIAAVLADEHSPFQHIQVFDTIGYGRMLVLDGKVQVSEWDEFVYHEMLAHVPLLAHPNPRTVMVMGGGDGGTVREVLRHPSVERVVLVEIDGRVIELCRLHMPALNEGQNHEPRLEVRTQDASQYVKEAKGQFDAILVDSSDPEGPSERLFTPEFFEQVKSALKPDGVVSFQAGSPFFYQKQLAQMREDLGALFRNVRAYLMAIPTYPGGTWCMMAASDEHDPAVAQRKPEFPSRYYTQDVHGASMALPPCFR